MAIHCNAIFEPGTLHYVTVVPLSGIQVKLRVDLI